MKLLLVMAIAWLGAPGQADDNPTTESLASEVEGASSVDLSPKAASTCSCDLEPLMPPATPEDILCCHRRVIADLVASDFAPDSPEFVSAIKRADVLIRGIENRMITV